MIEYLKTIISEAARSPPQEEGEEDGDRFWDPRSRTSFRFDHITLVRVLALVRIQTFLSVQ